MSLNVEEGDIVGIIGFSGAGKSTLIRTVNLLETPDSGKCLSTEQILPACRLPNFLRKEKRLG
ncbi:ATP-binding cassette domain-containing protein [Weeksellaceae bacterium A-14]